MVALALLLALLQWFGLSGQKAALRNMPFYHYLEALVWGTLLLCSLHLKAKIRWLFLNPLFSHFGSISYSLYLVHVPIQFYFIYSVKVEGVSGFLDPRLLAAVAASFLLSAIALSSVLACA